jgi:methylenetetrahydrofolate--tRNA-(uracil-5-)-methyltransferase
MADVVNVIGGGLAGVEAAWQAAEMGASVRLYEMRPVLQTPAHRTDKLAEIVCSNSLKTDEPGTAPYLLKEELRRGRSLVMEAAEATRVPAGAALSVDRIKFAEIVTDRIERHPNIEIVREEVRSIAELSNAERGIRSAESPLPPSDRSQTGVAVVTDSALRIPHSAFGALRIPHSAFATVVATGPLTSDALTESIMKFTGDDQLYFYDAIAPIVAADSIDMSIAFKAARYGKGGDDYINCPMERDQYARFIE